MSQFIVFTTGTGSQVGINPDTVNTLTATESAETHVKTNNGSSFSVNGDLASVIKALMQGTRCPSCDHLWDMHQFDGCWFAVTMGDVGANTVCVCTVPKAVPAAAVASMPLR